MATLNDLLVLNAEIAALVRAGIPLELGLRKLSQSVTGRLGSLAERLVVRLESGMSLVDALRREEETVSPLYAAVVEAALRANRLPEALEGITAFGRTLQETRRQVQLALMYPTIVACTAYGLFAIFVLVVGPAVLQAWDVQSAWRSQMLSITDVLQTWAWCWIPGVPAVCLLLLFLAARWNRRVSDTGFLVLEPGGGGVLAGSWIPGVSELYRDLDRAFSTRTLGLLIAESVPLSQALDLVARMTGSRQLSQSFHRLAQVTAEGRSLAAEVHYEPRLPPLIAQLLRAGALDRDLPDALHQASEIFTRRAIRRAAWLRSTLAPAFAVALGGTATALCAVAFGLPLRWFFLELLQFV